MVFKDYYKILGLETNRVTMDEIRVAYRAAAKKHHPDLNVGNDLAEEKIKDINEAYKILSVPATKKKYDRKWNLYVGRRSNLFDKKGNSKEVIKSMLFGNEVEGAAKRAYARTSRGDNIETAININIDEAFYGVEKKISLKNPEGKKKTVIVNIPQGIKQGEKIRLVGQGKEGKNGGKPGTLKITPWEAVLGKRITVNSIDDEDTKLYIAPGTQSGDTFTIPNRGYVKTDGSRGKLIIETKILVPKVLTKEEMNIFKKLDKISKYNPREA